MSQPKKKLSFHFNFMTNVIVAAPHREKPGPGEYHWHKLKDYHDPKMLKRKLRADGRFVALQDLIDQDRDIVGYCFDSPNVAAFRNAVKRILGKDHGLMIFEVASSKRGRERELRALRRS